jgi:hypothetical protein
MQHLIRLQKSDTGKIGTKRAGYAPPEDGPFRCSKCVHFAKVGVTDGRCNQSEVLADPEIPKDDDGKAIVRTAGCCTYFHN